MVMTALLSVGAAAAAAPAYAGSSHGGLKVGVDTVSVNADIDYSGGKPDPELSGSLVGGSLTYDHQLGVVVLGVRASYVNGELGTFERDGNYLVQGAWLKSLSTVEARIGLPLGRMMPYVSAGTMQRKTEISQSCPVSAAVPFGHCSTNGGPNGYDRHVTLDDSAPVYAFGIEYNASSNVAFNLEYGRADFGRVVVPLGNNGNTVPAALPPTDPEQEIEYLRFGVTVRLG